VLETELRAAARVTASLMAVSRGVSHLKVNWRQAPETAARAVAFGVALFSQ